MLVVMLIIAVTIADLKRELLSQQVKYEITELASPTALQRFGAPFRSDKGEVAPEDSELPILRYIFVHHVRNFPFLDQAKEEEFWQAKLQVFLESFANKRISGSEDRLEDTKRRKLSLKAQKLVELMMVSGIPTASGYEERIRFSEIEVVERGANEQGLVANAPQGHEINGWDVNVASVRTTSVKRHLRHHEEAEYLIRVTETGKGEHYIARQYEDFKRMHKRLRLELPGKILPPLPRHSSNDQVMHGTYDDSDGESMTGSPSLGPAADSNESVNRTDEKPSSSGGYVAGLRSYLTPFSGSSTPKSNHSRNRSTASIMSENKTPRASSDLQRGKPLVLYRETSRVSLRAALRTLLGNERIAQSSAMRDFLTHDQIEINEEELADIDRRKELDERRIREQKQFYDVAKARAAELDVHMERFRRDVVEHSEPTLKSWCCKANRLQMALRTCFKRSRRRRP